MFKYAKNVNTEKLQIERKKKGYTYRDMAKLMGFKSPASYYNIEVGITNPNVDNINKIADILEKPAENFFNIKVQQK